MIRSGSKGSYGIFFIVALLVLAALVIFLIGNFEVYEQTVSEGPSAELRSNTFYVLGRWLSENGHPVRFSPHWAGIKDLAPREGGLLLAASFVDWDREGESLLSWVREGGTLIVSVDYRWYWNRRSSGDFPNLVIFDNFLKGLGLRIRNPDVEDDEDQRELGADDFALFPDYDFNFSLAWEDETGEIRESRESRESSQNREALILQDGWGMIRLVRMALGKGQLTVTGTCRFMYNDYLNENLNARLSWELTGASLTAERPVMLFVRGRRAAGGLWEALRERGNLLPPLLSILVLVFIGFWTVIPGFGIRRELQAPVRGTIGGRFVAEARFFRRYGAYGIYLEAYLRELRRRSGGQEQEPEIKNALAAGKPVSSRKMAVYLKNLMSALERI
jgi:hypothetical protein